MTGFLTRTFALAPPGGGKGIGGGAFPIPGGAGGIGIPFPPNNGGGGGPGGKFREKYNS